MRRQKTLIMHIYGNINNYQTGKTVRPASREDWLTARSKGDAHTGAHADLDGVTVFCDGPDEDPIETAVQHHIRDYTAQWSLTPDQIWATPHVRDVQAALGIDGDAASIFEALVAAGARDDQAA